jgi:hypothetical protein
MTSFLVTSLLALGGLCLLSLAVALVRVRRRRVSRNLGVVSERWLTMYRVERW